VADTVVGDLVARLRADTSDFKKGLGEAESQTRSFSDKLESAGKSAMSVGAKMTVGLTAPLALFGKTAFDAASDLNESMSKVEVVFKDKGQAIIDWSKDAAKSFGLSQQAALEAVGTFGNLFSAMGFGHEVAGSFSTSLVQLAADLASFNNANIDEVLVALRSGLLGEAEPLRKFGVSLSAARVEAEALASGLVKPISAIEDITKATIAVEKANTAAAKAMKDHGAESIQYREALTQVTAAEGALTEAMRGKVPELTAAQKAQASYNIIMKDTALAQGDFARTSEGAANQQRIMAAQFKDMQAQLGQALIPIFQQVAGVIQELAAWFTSLTPAQQEMIVYAGLIVAALGPLTTAIGAVITVISKLIDGAQAVGTALGKIPPAALGVAAIAGVLVGAVIGITQALDNNARAIDWNIQKMTGLTDAQYKQVAAFIVAWGGMNTLEAKIRELAETNTVAARQMVAAADLDNEARQRLIRVIEQEENVAARAAARSREHADALNERANAANRAAGALYNVAAAAAASADFGPTVPGVAPNAYDGFAAGGVVSGPEGAPRLAMVHGGEAVFNPDQLRALGSVMGGGGAQVIQLVVSGRVLAEVMRDEMLMTGQRNGSVLGQYA
jgi:hypothetical protein